jgi:hypothetical protein
MTVSSEPTMAIMSAISASVIIAVASSRRTKGAELYATARAVGDDVRELAAGRSTTCRLALARDSPR